MMLYLRDPEHREPIPVRPPAGGRRPARRPKPDPTHRLAPSKACSHSLNKSSKWVTPRKHGATAALVPLLTLLSGLLFYMSACGASGLALCSPGFAAVFLRHGHKVYLWLVGLNRLLDNVNVLTSSIRAATRNSGAPVSRWYFGRVPDDGGADRRGASQFDPWRRGILTRCGRPGSWLKQTT